MSWKINLRRRVESGFRTHRSTCSAPSYDNALRSRKFCCARQSSLFARETHLQTAVSESRKQPTSGPMQISRETTCMHKYADELIRNDLPRAGKTAHHTLLNGSPDGTRRGFRCAVPFYSASRGKSSGRPESPFSSRRALDTSRSDKHL